MQIVSDKVAGSKFILGIKWASPKWWCILTIVLCPFIFEPIQIVYSEHDYANNVLE